LLTSWCINKSITLLVSPDLLDAVTFAQRMPDSWLFVTLLSCRVWAMVPAGPSLWNILLCNNPATLLEWQMNQMPRRS